MIREAVIVILQLCGLRSLDGWMDGSWSLSSWGCDRGLWVRVEMDIPSLRFFFCPLFERMSRAEGGGHRPTNGERGKKELWNYSRSELRASGPNDITEAVRG